MEFKNYISLYLSYWFNTMLLNLRVVGPTLGQLELKWGPVKCLVIDENKILIKKKVQIIVILLIIMIKNAKIKNEMSLGSTEI